MLLSVMENLKQRRIELYCYKVLHKSVSQNDWKEMEIDFLNNLSMNPFTPK